MKQTHHTLTGATVLLAFAIVSPKAQAWNLQYAPLMTDWAQLVDTNQPLPEYPRPQMVRAQWLNLNGVWEFEPGALNDPVPTNHTLSSEILVPFPIESALSGVREHHARSWYRRTFAVPTTWEGQRILLHFDAVDWESEVFINGQSVGVHRGGYDAFDYDITPYLSGTGPQELIVRVYDATDGLGVPRGKQTLYPGGIMYTSCSGIWQTVWLEPVPATSISSFKLVPDIDAERLLVTVSVSGPTNGVTVNARARMGGDTVSSMAGLPGALLSVPVPSPNLWSPTNPFLYDLDLTLVRDGTNLDAVTSYFGMRKIALGTNGGFVKMLLNNQFVFQFGPLDQGFWPDGIYRAPTDAALKSDLEQEKVLGYNMVRKHIKVEPARWYYWADKLGILVWQDMPSANSYTSNPQPLDAPQFETELTRLVQNHWNHPSIIMWVIFNEGQGQHDTAQLVDLVKTLDPSRLVNQASGGSYFGVGDILDGHSYPNPNCPVSATQAIVCGEFGGVGLPITNHTWAPGWGYVAATNGDDLGARFEDFCFQLSDFVQNRGLSAAVYTEITDVEVELNGFLTYDRKVRKPDADRIRAGIAMASAPVNLTTVVPTSQNSGQIWKYTTTAPGPGWRTASYNDFGWSSGPGGFGANDPPNTTGLIRTTWNTADIWLRRTFNPGSLTPQQLTNLFFMVYNDEDVELYINCVLAGSATGYRTSYGLMTMTESGRAAILPNANNLLAVHCHQTSGGQYIDAGLTVRDGTAVLPTRPVPATPMGLHGTAGLLGASLAWNSCADATLYRVKRSKARGGPYTNVVTSPVSAGTDASVEPGVTYYYVVSAGNASGESADSLEISLTAPTLPRPVLRTWFKADDITGLPNGAALAAWQDESGYDLNATQDTPARRPSFVTGAVNGLPAVRFNASASNYMVFPRPVEDDFTIFCVYRSDQGLGTGTQFYQGAGLVNGEVAGTVNDFGLSLNANGKLLAGTGKPDTTIASSASDFNDGRPHLVSFWRKQSTGALALYVDGLPQGTATGGAQSLTAPVRLVLGAQQTLLNFLSGDIAEVKIYGSALTEGQRVAEENALTCKYGLGPGAPPPAPRNLSAIAINRRISLSWEPCVGADSYTLTSSTNSSGPYALLAANVTSTNYVHTNAVSGVTNYYRVTAVSPCGESAPSGAAVWLPLPQLSFSLTGRTLAIFWPGWASDWILWSATNLAPPVIWSQVTNAIQAEGDQLKLIVPIKEGSCFLRLASP